MLLEAPNRHKFKLLVRRVQMTKAASFDEIKQTLIPEKSINMWGLFTLEDIPAGAFIVEYSGEVITKKEGDIRGKMYDKLGMRYLFDMNDPDEND